jgi:hypothetical protein
MDLPRSFNTVTPFSKTLTLVLFVSLPFVGFYFGYQYHKNIFPEILPTNATIYKNFQASITPSSSTLACAKQGLQSKDDYLPIYVVKKGDSLLSIAKSQLGNSSRINELITLNKDRYPQLSVGQPFLEQGWKLNVIPKNFGITNGNVYIFSGNIELYPNNPNFWGVKWNGGSGGTFSIKELNNNQGNIQFKNGDCVTVIYQAGETEKTFSIIPQ